MPKHGKGMMQFYVNAVTKRHKQAGKESVTSAQGKSAMQSGIGAIEKRQRSAYKKTGMSGTKDISKRLKRIRKKI